jgi:hypothetical protein
LSDSEKDGIAKPRSSASSVPLCFKEVRFLPASAFQRSWFSPCLCVSVVDALRDRLQHVGGRGVVAEGFTHMDEKIFIPGRKHKTAAELERILSQPMLLVSRSLCAAAGLHIVFAQQVEKGSVAQPNSFICFTFFIDKERKMDTSLLAEEPGISGVTQADDSKMSAFTFELGFKFAQLRDVLSAKDSTVMAKEDHHGRSAFPQGAKPCRLAVGIRKRNSCELAAERFTHAGHSLGRMADCQAALLRSRTYKSNGCCSSFKFKGFKFEIFKSKFVMLFRLCVKSKVRLRL